MVPGILADVNVTGHLRVLLGRFQEPSRRELWSHLNFTTPTFQDLGLMPNTSDLVVWQTCQREQLFLLTANRNQKGSDSLEGTIRLHNTPESLPVFTLANADRVLADPSYAGWVADRFLDYLFDIDKYRGTGRLYLP
jgi:hypothetical protein